VPNHVRRSVLNRQWCRFAWPQAGTRCLAKRIFNMDDDRIAGAAKQVKGSVKEAIGKITGDSKTQAEGTAEKTAGKIQNTVGNAKDTLRDAADK